MCSEIILKIQILMLIPTPGIAGNVFGFAMAGNYIVYSPEQMPMSGIVVKISTNAP
jgi:hypothetical protein